jgi:hypothetical protein
MWWQEKDLFSNLGNKIIYKSAFDVFTALAVGERPSSVFFSPQIGKNKPFNSSRGLNIKKIYALNGKNSNGPSVFFAFR